MMNSTNKKRNIIIISFFVSIAIVITIFIAVIFSFLNSVFTLAKGDNMSKLKSMSTNEMIEEFEKIVDMINDGDLYVDSNGCIILPDNQKYLSDSGECFIVEFNNKTAIEFFLYRGLLDSGSKSYIYITNKLSYNDYIDEDKYNSLNSYTIIKEITANLCLCSVTS